MVVNARRFHRPGRKRECLVQEGGSTRVAAHTAALLVCIDGCWATMPFFVGPITPNAAMLELCVSMLWLSEKVCRDVYRQGTVKSACKKGGGRD